MDEKATAFRAEPLLNATWAQILPLSQMLVRRFETIDFVSYVHNQNLVYRLCWQCKLSKPLFANFPILEVPDNNVPIYFLPWEISRKCHACLIKKETEKDAKDESKRGTQTKRRKFATAPRPISLTSLSLYLSDEQQIDRDLAIRQWDDDCPICHLPMVTKQKRFLGPVWHKSAASWRHVHCAWDWSITGKEIFSMEDIARLQWSTFEELLRFTKRIVGYGQACIKQTGWTESTDILRQKQLSNQWKTTWEECFRLLASARPDFLLALCK